MPPLLTVAGAFYWVAVPETWPRPYLGAARLLLALVVLFSTFMKHVFTSATFLRYGRRGALLLALGAAGPATWGQSFGSVSTYATEYHPSNIVVADNNGDGRPDVITTHTATNVMSVLLGQAGGGLGPMTDYQTGQNSGPKSGALGDVNGDGRLDIITANMQNSTIGVLLAQVGGFAPVVSYSTGVNSGCDDLALGDMNGDGRLDVVTANFQSNTIRILLGQAGGGFNLSSTTYTINNRPEVVRLSDVDKDGQLDIVVLYPSTNAVGVLLRLASGSVATPVTYSIGANTYPVSLALGDVNGDGRLDIITGNASSTVSVLAGQTGGSFGAVSNYSIGAGSNVQGIALGDVNGDSRLDIVTANYQNNTVGVLVGQVGGFAPVASYATGANSGPLSVALGDANGDGRPDIFTANNTASSIGILLNTGTYTPLATARPTAADITLAPNPAHGAFIVQLPTSLLPTSAELLNALGQVVRRPAVGAGSFTVATSGLAPGIYTLRLLAGGAALARRVVVE